MLQNKIYHNYLIEIFRTFLIILFGLSLIALTVRAVNFLDLIVDSGYDGEIFVNLHNIGTEPRTIKPGEKVAQAVLVPVIHAQFEQISEDSVYGVSTERGSGALGSTGAF